MKRIIYFIFVLTIIWGCEKETAYREIVEVEGDGISVAINKSVIVIDRNNSTKISYSEDNQTVSISGTEELIEENSILVIDLDTAGVIRKVVSVNVVNNVTVCETEQATMEDIFGEANFKLSTSMIQPESSSGRLNTNAEISRALTDDDGFIHPVEIIYHTQDGPIFRRADDVEGQFGDNLHTYIDFSGKKIFKNRTVNFYISEGYAEFAPVFKFEFDYDKPHIDWDDLEIEKGKLNKFKFWSDETKFEFKTMLTFEVEKEIYKEDVKILGKNVIETDFTFYVGHVPVYISIDCDIYGKYILDFSSQLEATMGFKATRHITLGILYENGTWSEFHDYRKEDTFYPPQLSGNATFSQRLEIYPHFDVKLYKILGPNLDIVPFIYNENNVDISGDWDAHLDLGLDLRIGAELEVLGKDLLSYQSDNINLYTDTVWEASGEGDKVLFGDKILIVNPDHYRINVFGRLNEGDNKYYSVATGEMTDDNGNFFTSPWSNIGKQNDFIGEILNNKGYLVEYTTAEDFSTVNMFDYKMVIIENPLDAHLKSFNRNVEDNIFSNQESFTQEFIEKIKNYFNNNGKLLLIGEAIKILENGEGKLNFGKTILYKYPNNYIPQNDSRLPKYWLFSRGNPFCGVNRHANAKYYVKESTFIDQGSIFSEVDLYNGTDFPNAIVWSEMVYYPSDGNSLLDLRIEGEGEYVLSGNICNPTVYKMKMDEVIPNYFGYTIVENSPIYYVGSPMFFNYSMRSREGAWHTNDNTKLEYSISENGSKAFINLVNHILSE